MTPFDFINTARSRLSPFSVPCPHCGATSTYREDQSKICPSTASKVAMDVGGADPDVLEGTFFGECQCTNKDCQEYTHFIGPFVGESFGDEEHPMFTQRYTIAYFFPPVPLIRIPSNTPENVRSLLKRSFAPAFTDKSAAGNLLRSAIETLLTNLRVARFTISKKGKRNRLTLHDRILRLPHSLEDQKDRLLAIKWIGNFASHDTLEAPALQTGFKIVEGVLEDIYGTEKLDLIRSIKRINRRKRP